MQAVIDVALPVFAIMLAGFLAGRMRLLGPASSEALNGFVYWVALPSLFIRSMAGVPIGQILHPGFLIGLLGTMTLTFLFALLVAKVFFRGSRAETGMHATTVVYGNTGYMGLPLLLTAFGEAGVLPSVISTVVNGTIVIALATAILEVDRSQAASRGQILRDILRGIARSPLVGAALVGLLLSAAEVDMPTPVDNFLDLMSSAAAPCALFAMGLFMVGRSFKADLTEVGVLVVQKLIVMPAIAWAFVAWVVDLEPVLAASLIILSALPTGSLVFVVCQQYGVYVQRTTGAIVVSTILSVPTVALLVGTYVPG